MSGRRTAAVPNPAVVPEPEPRAPRRYRVIGAHTVLGHKPRSTFTALLPESQEAHLVEAGHLQILPAKSSQE